MNESGNVLAFIGDAVLTLQVREYLVQCGITNLGKLQTLSTRFVSANAQAEYMMALLEAGDLSDEELAIYKRGRNAKSHSVAKNADVVAYRVATGFEALWGYLHLTKNEQRLSELWAMFKERVELDA